MIKKYFKIYDYKNKEGKYYIEKDNNYYEIFTNLYFIILNDHTYTYHNQKRFEVFTKENLSDEIIDKEKIKFVKVDLNKSFNVVKIEFESVITVFNFYNGYYYFKKDNDYYKISSNSYFTIINCKIYTNGYIITAKRNIISDEKLINELNKCSKNQIIKLTNEFKILQIITKPIKIENVDINTFLYYAYNYYTPSKTIDYYLGVDYLIYKIENDILYSREQITDLIVLNTNEGLKCFDKNLKTKEFNFKLLPIKDIRIIKKQDEEITKIVEKDFLYIEWFTGIIDERLTDILRTFKYIDDSGNETNIKDTNLSSLKNLLNNYIKNIKQDLCNYVNKHYTNAKKDKVNEEDIKSGKAFLDSVKKVKNVSGIINLKKLNFSKQKEDISQKISELLLYQDTFLFIEKYLEIESDIQKYFQTILQKLPQGMFTDLNNDLLTDNFIKHDNYIYIIKENKAVRESLFNIVSSFTNNLIVRIKIHNIIKENIHNKEICEELYNNIINNSEIMKVLENCKENFKCQLESFLIRNYYPDFKDYDNSKIWDFIIKTTKDPILILNSFLIEKYKYIINSKFIEENKQYFYDNAIKKYGSEQNLLFSIKKNKFVKLEEDQPLYWDVLEYYRSKKGFETLYNEIVDNIIKSITVKNYLEGKQLWINKYLIDGQLKKTVEITITQKLILDILFKLDFGSFEPKRISKKSFIINRLVINNTYANDFYTFILSENIDKYYLNYSTITRNKLISFISDINNHFYKTYQDIYEFCLNHDFNSQIKNIQNEFKFLKTYNEVDLEYYCRIFIDKTNILNDIFHQMLIRDIKTVIDYKNYYGKILKEIENLEVQEYKNINIFLTILQDLDKDKLLEIMFNKKNIRHYISFKTYKQLTNTKNIEEELFYILRRTSEYTTKMNIMEIYKRISKYDDENMVHAYKKDYIQGMDNEAIINIVNKSFSYKKSTDETFALIDNLLKDRYNPQEGTEEEISSMIKELHTSKYILRKLINKLRNLEYIEILLNMMMN